MPTTSNFGWTTPADTDLVKDGAAAIRTLGNGIDTSFIDLKGGTTGQVLSKASNTDLDYSWVTPNVGDITEVQAGTGISVASGTGPIPVVTNSMATEITASGDIIVGTGSGTFDNLPIGTTGQVLTADTSVSPYKVKWAATTPSGLVLVKSQTIGTAVSSVNVTSAFSATYNSYRIIVNGGTASVDDELIGLKMGATTTGYYAAYFGYVYSTGNAASDVNNNATSFTRAGLTDTNGLSFVLDIINPFTANRTYFNGGMFAADNSFRTWGGHLNNTTSYTDFTLTPASGTLTGGTIYVYGYLI